MSEEKKPMEPKARVIQLVPLEDTYTGFLALCEDGSIWEIDSETIPGHTFKRCVFQPEESENL